MAEKILAAHCGKEQVRPGEIINAKLDFVVGNEVSSNMAIQEFYRLGCKKVFDNERIAIVPDHQAPNRGIDEAEVCKAVREFARCFDIKNYYEVGQSGGILHVIVPEKGLVGPGDLVFGADSHTCTYGALGAFATGMGSTDMLCAMVLGEIWMKVPGTIKILYNGKLPKGIGGKDLILYTIGKIGVDGATYKSIEFTGEALRDLPMDGRFTMANMSIEAGAKCGLFEPDERTIQYVNGRCERPYTVYRADEDAEYDQIIEFDVSDLEHQVALPHLPENVVPVSEAGKDGKIYLDQVFIGSCVGGLFDDLKTAADILKGRKVNERLRLIVIPGSQETYRRAIKAGVIDTLVEAGAAVGTPMCGPCGGRNMGILASGEKCATTTNRNFKGRMGHMDSEVYLVGPGVAAASAILGYLATPGEVK
jgi:3-isopropylmalate/(R)-2-methylmalate dehydratase large subunit